MTSLLRRLLLVKVLLLAFAISAFAGNAPCDGLAARMAERLAIMEKVAAYKFIHDRAVEDPEREAALLESMEAQGSELGIPGATTRAFFTAQMEAAKQVQRERIAAWKNGDAPEQAPDLATEVRPELDRLSAMMLRELLSANAHPSPEAQEAAGDCLRGQGYSAKVVELAVSGWPSAVGEE